MAEVTDDLSTPEDVIEAASIPEAGEVLVTDPDQTATLDARFTGIPPFTEWTGLAVDYEAWTVKFEEFKERRARSSQESLTQAVEVALRAAAVDTGAIEGLYSLPANFTITVATQAPGWEAMVDSMGDSFKALFQSQLRAYELAMKLSRSPVGVTEAWVRELHKELCSSQRTYRVITAVGPQEHELPVGEYKHHPNHVRLPDGSFHAYASVDATRREMPRLIEWLRDPLFIAANPALQAAYAHFALVAIHPFADGNGRVARALASTLLCRAAGVPLVVFDDQKDAYLAALRAADRGTFLDFVKFILLRSVDSLEFVSDRLGATARQQAERVAAILRGTGGLTPADVDGLAIKLLDFVQKELEEHARTLPLPTGVHVSAGGRSWMQQQPRYSDERYRSLGSTPTGDLVVASVFSQSPSVIVNRNLQAVAAKSSSDRYLCAVRVLDTARMLEVRMDELLPQATASLQFKVRSWVERTLAETLSDFGTAAAKQLST